MRMQATSLDGRAWKSQDFMELSCPRSASPNSRFLCETILSVCLYLGAARGRFHGGSKCHAVAESPWGSLGLRQSMERKWAKNSSRNQGVKDGCQLQSNSSCHVHVKYSEFYRMLEFGPWIYYFLFYVLFSLVFKIPWHALTLFIQHAYYMQPPCQCFVSSIFRVWSFQVSPWSFYCHELFSKSNEKKSVNQTVFFMELAFDVWDLSRWMGTFCFISD